MLTESELRALLAGESDRVEFTNSTKNTDKFAQAACAFANDFPDHRKPGYLLVGVNDDGTISGLSITDRLLRTLGELRANVNLEPIPAITVGKCSVAEGDVAVVEVQPSDLPPVRYKGRVWIRTGPSRRQANRQEEKMLVEKRASGEKPFDLRPCSGAHLSDLALELFRVTYLPSAVSGEILLENDREPVEQMASLRLYDLTAGRPTGAAVLLFGKDPLHWIPGAYVQFVRWSGTTLASVPDWEKQFSGDLVTVLRELDGFASLPVRSRPVPETAFREVNETDYPPVAVRELLLNAVMHRSYESNAPVRFNWFPDRIEIQSPGGLYGLASAENFPHQTDYRNPVLAEAMANLGYVNRFGRGVLRAQAALRENGNTPAEFSFEPGYVLVTIRRKV